MQDISIPALTNRLATALGMTLAASVAACSAGDPAPPARVVTQLEVSIDAANNCSLENQPVSCQQVAATIRTRYPTSKPHIFICVDKLTRAEAALEVMNSVSAAGFPPADFRCGNAAAG